MFYRKQLTFIFTPESKYTLTRPPSPAKSYTAAYTEGKQGVLLRAAALSFFGRQKSVGSQSKSEETRTCSASPQVRVVAASSGCAAIKGNLIPPELSARQISLACANEADVLNLALFGMTAKQWRDAHPDLKGSIRDYANVSQLVCLSNLENLNAVFINEGMPQAERLAKLNAIAISQMKVLTEDHRLLQLDAATDTQSKHDCMCKPIQQLRI